MKCLIANLGAALFLASCASNASEAPDPDNPAHCTAAFMYTRNLALAPATRNEKIAQDAAGRAAYEVHRSNQIDRDSDWAKISADFAKAHPTDLKLLKDLTVACVKRQDADPVFRKANKEGKIIAAGRLIE